MATGGPDEQRARTIVPGHGPSSPAPGRAYAELAGAPPGAAIDILAALADMVACNGGAPLTCLA